MTANSLAFSRAESDEVGSSKMRMLGLLASARAISTIWRSPMPSFSTCVLWTEPATQPVEERLRAGGHGGGIDEAGAPWKIFDEHVLRHRHGREQRELLMDESDTVGARIARRGDARHAACNTNFSALGCDDSSENVHQRALARAVRAHERVGFARLNGKMGVLERADASEGLRDAGHIEGGPDHREALPEMRSIQMNRMIAIPFTTRFMKYETPSWFRLLLMRVTNSAPSTAPVAIPAPP